MRLLTILAFVGLVLNLVLADDSPGFFLKITKNVPRLGKRSENFVMKNIPRIGRSSFIGGQQSSSVTPLMAWLWDLDIEPVKRRYPTSDQIKALERELNVVQPVNSNTLIELLDKNAIPSEQVKFVHWKDFDRALQSDMDLYAKVIQLGRRPDQRLKEDLNLNSYIPIFGTNNEQNGDFIMLNSNDRDLYGSRSRFDRNFMKYNHL
ncbi:uncharacterized protein Dwil_GK21645 [Drosophila willistoni]|uniref:GK21645 n=1 Tax=Drosophila willistoni TaxID=7260 RepID=B4MPA2_DROWI|nr:uncharacterized protein LOC6639995 [Drosophila willistoni]EDW73941.1 uncharacterized protein Dwil_GK21645 [Drosophila willistoni]